MHVDKQLSAFLENKPGTLAAMCEALAEQDVNLLAMTVSDTVDHAVVRMVVDKPEEALHILGESGILVVTNEVLIIEVANYPGALAEMAQRLARNRINIEYAYCTTSENQPEGILVLRTHDPEGAMQALGGNAR
jgi:hypothetical protein